MATKLPNILARGMRISLWLLLLLSALLAMESLRVALYYGFSLWQVHNPLPAFFWLATFMLPAFIVWGLRSAKTQHPKLAIIFIAAWAFVIFWPFYAFSWQEKTLSISINDSKYTFSRELIKSIPPRHDRKKNEILFIVLKSPGDNFDLAYDDIAEYRGTYRGKNIKVVTLLEYDPKAHFSFSRSGQIDIVCRKLLLGHRCGFTVLDKGNLWSILFPPAAVKDAPRIQREAIAFLRRSREPNEINR